MKPFHSFAMLAAIAAVSQASAADAVTTPVGYVTETLRPNMYNLVGLTVQSPTLSAGVITSATANSVVVDGADFTTLLESGSTYILEIESAEGTNVIQEVNAWGVSSLTVDDDLTSTITGGETKYKLRKAPTISDVFGAQNSAGLTGTSSVDISVADKVLIRNEAGTAFTTVFYYDDGSFTGWFDTEFNPADDLSIVYLDSFYVQRGAGDEIDLVVSGEVQKSGISTILQPGYNFLGGVYPVGSTLTTSSLSESVTPTASTSIDAADTVLVQQSNGGYKTYFYYDDGSFTGWFDTEFNPADDVAIPSGLVVQNKGVEKPLTHTAPSSYANL